MTPILISASLNFKEISNRNNTESLKLTVTYNNNNNDTHITCNEINCELLNCWLSRTHCTN